MLWITLMLALLTERDIPPTESNTFLYREQAVAPASVKKGEAMLSVKPLKLRAGEKVAIDITYASRSSGHQVFNPFFSANLPPPAALMVYDAEKQVIGNYLAQRGESLKSAGKDDWVYLPAPNARVGTVLSQVAGQVPETQWARASRRLPPGRYYVQVVFYDGFFSFNNRTRPGDLEAIARFYNTFDRREALRSNVVEIEIAAGGE
jgi:hypothetical protein